MAKAIGPQAVTILLRSSGSFPTSVVEYVASMARAHPPLLAWADPVPTACDNGKPGRHVAFRPLVSGVPDWPSELPLAEVRLFRPDAALHVVANESGGGRWALIQEQPGGETAQGEVVARSEIPIMTVRDRDRFGLSKSEVDDMDLVAVEYRRRGRLVAWRLTLKA